MKIRCDNRVCKCKKVLFTLGLVLFVQIGLSIGYLDSLKKVWDNKNLPDSVRLAALYDYGWDGYLYSDLDSAIYYGRMQARFAVKAELPVFEGKAYNLIGMAYYYKNWSDSARFYHEKNLSIRKELKDDYGAAAALSNLGMVYTQENQYDSALTYYNEALITQTRLKDYYGVALTNLNIGEIHYLRYNYPEASAYYHTSLRISEKYGINEILISALNNIGILHSNQQNFETALEYFNKALELREADNNVIGMANSYGNIGATYSAMGEHVKAIEFHEKAMSNYELSGDEHSIAMCHNNIGNNLLNLDKEDEAFSHFNIASNLAKKNNDIGNIIASNHFIAEIYFRSKKFKEALQLTNEVHALCIEYDYLDAQGQVAELRQLIFSALGDYKNAYFSLQESISIRDSLKNESNLRSLIEQQYQYSYEKQAATDSIKNAEIQKVKDAQLATQESENKRKTQQSYYLIGVLILVAVFLLLVFNRFRISQKQKAIIEIQKQRVDQAFVHLEEKNKEILDSINYAKKIQEAILPPERYFAENLPKSFVLYLPKDVVAGDFYWLDKFENQLTIAVADCTGHGVPGAMVSVVCHNALTRAVREFGLKNPADILDKTRELVISTFEKSDREVNDGMDISFCSVNYNSNVISFTGANNGLILMRNSQLIEFKPDKQPIGKFANTKPFTMQTIQTEPGDRFYLYSDGYADQFGGFGQKAGGKKFKHAQLKLLITELHQKPFAEQRRILHESLLAWRREIEQVDDICIIGFEL